MRLLDLFCGAGGAAAGYHRAGFDEIVGVDNRPMPRYPFEFECLDAIEVLEALVAGSCFGINDWELHHFDAIHASPPCQAFTSAAHVHRLNGKAYPDLVATTRELLEATGLPHVIENVPGAPIRPDLVLCGCVVGLKSLRRVRWFECSWAVSPLRSPCYHTEPAVTVAGRGEPSGTYWRRHGLPNRSLDDWKAAMGIDWMTRLELAQAIPPAYTEYIGRQLIEQLQRGKATPLRTLSTRRERP